MSEKLHEIFRKHYLSKALEITLKEVEKDVLPLVQELEASRREWQEVTKEMNDENNALADRLMELEGRLSEANKRLEAIHKSLREEHEWCLRLKQEGNDEPWVNGYFRAIEKFEGLASSDPKKKQEKKQP